MSHGCEQTYSLAAASLFLLSVKDCTNFLYTVLRLTVSAFYHKEHHTLYVHVPH